MIPSINKTLTRFNPASVILQAIRQNKLTLLNIFHNFTCCNSAYITFNILQGIDQLEVSDYWINSQ